MALNKLKRLVGPQAFSSGTLITVPNLHTYILRHIRVVNPSVAAIQFKLGIGGTADANLITNLITVPAGEMYVEDLHVTLEYIVGTGGETLQASVTGSGGTITVEGIDQN